MVRSLPTAAELAASGALPEGADIAVLNRGRTLAITKCSGCHRFCWPEEYSARDWTKVVRRQGRRMSLGRGQIGAIEAYFVTASRILREAAGAASGSRAAPGE